MPVSSEGRLRTRQRRCAHKSGTRSAKGLLNSPRRQTRIVARPGRRGFWQTLKMNRTLSMNFPSAGQDGSGTPLKRL